VATLLACDEPGIRLQANRDLRGRQVDLTGGDVLGGPRVTALLAGPREDGSFGNHPYSKWTGAHWRLISLVELGLAHPEPRAVAAFETVLQWLLDSRRLRNVPIIDGRYRRCASQEGNALAVAVRLGLTGDGRVDRLAENLMRWQWPDGGWNCDRRTEARHSSFHETVAPLWGLAEYAGASADRTAAEAALRACELLLEHRVFMSHRTGEIADPAWVRLRYPVYWHYDMLQGLQMLARAGALPDTRAEAALEMLRAKQRADGMWHVEGTPYWKLSGPHGAEVVRWERRGPSLMLTLNALRVLKIARHGLA
jgi:hypothetical protein